jgi:hypothetical protein
MIRNIIVFFLLCALTACYNTKYPYDSKGLTYRNKLVFNNQIKMGGYFYSQTKSGIITALFFEDGYYGGHTSYDSISNSCEIIDSVVREIPYAWGCYIIENDTLKLQYIVPCRSIFHKFKVGELWAKIEDGGSTLRHFQKKDIKGKISVMDKVYKFHPCTNKPASYNILMKQKKK